MLQSSAKIVIVAHYRFLELFSIVYAYFVDNDFSLSVIHFVLAPKSFEQISVGFSYFLTSAVSSSSSAPTSSSSESTCSSFMPSVIAP